MTTRDPRGMRIETHRYGGYSRGCRCAECKQAKAKYMRARRTEHRELAQKHTRSSTGARPSGSTARAPGATRYVAPIQNHGTRFGYEEHSCRCFPCTDARVADDRSRPRRGASKTNTPTRGPGP